MIKEINFSKKAVERINQLIAKKPSGTFFRIAVKGGGCSGFKYDFSFDNKIDENDDRLYNQIIKMNTYVKYIEKLPLYSSINLNNITNPDVTYQNLSYVLLGNKHTHQIGNKSSMDHRSLLVLIYCVVYP